jgi:hypothetical protein
VFSAVQNIKMSTTETKQSHWLSYEKNLFKEGLICSVPFQVIGKSQNRL